MSDPSTWQDVLDPPFVQRLLRPWQRPGRIDPAWSNRIFARYQQPMTPLPLVDHFVERQYRAANRQPTPLPFVFAQPVSAQPAPPDPTISQTTSQTTDGPMRPSQAGPSQSSAQPIVIQAKLMDSARSSGLPATSRGHATSHPTVTPLGASLAPSPAPPPVLPVTPPLPSMPSPPSSDRPFVTPARPPATATHSPARRLRRAGLRQEATPQFSPDNQFFPDNQPTVAVPPASETFAFPGVPLAIPAVAESSPGPHLPLATPESAVPAPGESFELPSVLPSVLPRVVVQSVRAPNQLPHCDQPLALPRVAVRSPHPYRDHSATHPISSRAAEPLANARNPSLLPSLPLVQISGRPDLTGQSPPQPAQPLVFSAPTTGPAHPSRSGFLADPGMAQSGYANAALSAASAARSMPIVHAQVNAQANSPVNGSANGSAAKAPPDRPPPESQVDIDALASKVERKLLRKLVVEQERRGWKP
jgi:hypothetical protein